RTEKAIRILGNRLSWDIGTSGRLPHLANFKLDYLARHILLCKKAVKRNFRKSFSIPFDIFFIQGFLFLSNEAGASFLSATFFVFPGLGINGGPAGEDGSAQSAARSEFAADRTTPGERSLAPQIYLAFIFRAV